MAKPSLALIPSAVGDGALYSVLPSTGVGDFDFTRIGTATRVNAQGLIETVDTNTPRLNYPLIDGKVSGCPSLLLEPARTNLITYSEDFTQWANTGNETTDTANYLTSPDGTLNATKLQEANSSFGYHRITKSISASSNENYSLSFFAKKGTLKYVQLLLINTSNSNTISKVFDIEDGVIGETISYGSGAVLESSSIEDYGNGWYKCSFVGRIGSNPNVFRINLADKLNGNSVNLGMVRYTGDSNGNIYIWGAQLEQGSYPTSYIPTSGIPITRSAETANGAGDASTFNDSEGVLMAEISALANDGTYRGITITDGTLDNRVSFYFRPEANSINFRVRTDITGTPTDSINNIIVAPNSLEFNKVALKYKENDFSIWFNGIKLVTDTVGDVFLNGTLNQLVFDRADGLDDFYGNTKQIQYYDTALTDSDLETLTSWDSFSEMATGQLYTIQ